MKLLFVTNIPSPYRVCFFNELGKLCDLTVVFERDNSGERDTSWKQFSFEQFKGVFLKSAFSTGVDSAFCPGIVKFLRQNKFDRIILANVSSPTVLLAIRYLKRHKIDYFIEIDGGLPKSGAGLKEKIKTYFIGGAAGYFSPAKASDAYCTTYGADHERVHRYPFTSLYQKEILSTPPTSEEKAALRKELSLTEDKIVVSVGRFSYLGGYGKGYDTLLTVAETLPPDVGIYIIGDEPTEEFVKWKEEKHLDRVHYLSYKQKADLFRYYRAADLSVLLTRGDVWGLVVNESMANACPVLTTTACVAGLALIEDGKNGYLVPAGDPAATKEKLLAYLQNEELQARFPAACLRTITPYTYESMAQVHKEILSLE